MSQRSRFVRRRFGLLPIASLILAVAIPWAVLASELDTAVIDVTAPLGSVTLAPGESAPVKIVLTVSGRQSAPATVTLNTVWTLRNGIFTGSSPRTVTVFAKEDGYTDAYQVDATVSVAAEHRGAGSFPLRLDGEHLAISTAGADPLRYRSSVAYEVIVPAPAAKIDPTLSWAPPAPIRYGTPLGAAQLNAAADVPGSFVYTPRAGTVLSPGAHTLRADFTPADGAAYNRASATVRIEVLAPALDGFFRPVDMDGDWNRARAGSTVPLRFEVSGGASGAAGADAVAVTARAVPCPDGDGQARDASRSRAREGDLRCRETHGRFLCHWQTPRLSGACYVVTARAGDGSSISANFELR